MAHEPEGCHAGKKISPMLQDEVLMAPGSKEFFQPHCAASHGGLLCEHPSIIVRDPCQKLS